MRFIYNDRRLTAWVKAGLTALCAAAVAGCNPGTFGTDTGIDLGEVDHVGGTGDSADIPADGETVRGYVHTPLDIPLAGVRVTGSGGYEATSDSAGRFELPDAEPDEVITLTYSLEGYATTSNLLTVLEDGLNFVSQTMAPVDLTTEFDSADGLDFIIDGTHGFSILGDTVQNLDGTPYDGLVSLEATVWDRTTPLDEGGEYLASPGDGRGITTDGDSVLLYTFGMFQLALSGDDDQRLQAGPGIEIKVQVPDDSNFEDGDVVEYWDFDDNSSTWSETDSGTIATLPGGQQVWEFAPVLGLPVQTTTLMLAGNPDKPIVVVTSSTAKGVVMKAGGGMLAGAPVRIIAADQTFMVSTQTDAEGNFEVTVPPIVATPIGPNGRPMFIEVDYLVGDKPSLWRANPVLPVGPGGVLEFGEVGVGSMTCLAGVVVDDDGAPVTDVEVSSPHGGNAVSGADGRFELAVPKWQPSTVYAQKPTSNLGFQPLRFRPSPQTTSACNNEVTVQAYAETACAAGIVTVNGLGADGVRVEAFDDRYPGGSVFSTLTETGEYSITIPAGRPVTVRVGTGDNAEGNACATYTVVGAADGLCEELPTFECGQ